MQTNTSKKTNSRHVQSTQTRNVRSRFEPENNRQPMILLAILCLLLPPIGVLLLWRSSRMTMPVRAALSAAGLASMTLIFFLLMRPTSTASTTILPVPVTPVQAGYGVSATDPYTAQATNVPAQPDAVIISSEPTADPSVAQEPGELTDDTIVYAVTNNASSYHLSVICDQQENHRSLTLREALDEGLAPCEKCVGAVG